MLNYVKYNIIGYILILYINLTYNIRLPKCKCKIIIINIAASNYRGQAQGQQPTMPSWLGVSDQLQQRQNG